MNTPICDFLNKYAASRPARFHMPGHKGESMLGFEALDITEVCGADVLYSPSGIILESENNASQIFDTGHTFYSAEGASLAIRAMLAIVKAHSKKGRIIAARNAHKSFIYACALLDIEILWINSREDEHICKSTVDLALLKEQILSLKKELMAVYITTPDYLGNILPLGEIAAICTEFGLPLLVDNAHGAYLKFLNEDIHPITLGAAMCADSAHKTLPAITGAAYLHISKGAKRGYIESAREFLSLFASTSPSYLTLASLDNLNGILASDFKDRLSVTVKAVKGLKARLMQNGIPIEESEPLKIVIKASEIGYTGDEIADLLRSKGIECEFSDKTVLVLMCSPGNNEEDYEKLASALIQLEKREKKEIILPKISRGKRALSLKEALFSEKESVDLQSAEGRICAGVCISCPPAVPIAICGEIIDGDTVNALRFYGVEKIEVVSN